MPTIKQAKALTITFLTPVSLGSLNGSDKEADNLSSIKKLTRGTKSYPYVSSQALRRALARPTRRDGAHDLSEGDRPPRRRRVPPSPMPAQPSIIDDDLFGFMDARKEARTSGPAQSASPRCWPSILTRATSTSARTTWAWRRAEPQHLRDRDPRRALSRHAPDRARRRGKIATGEGVSAETVEEALGPGAGRESGASECPADGTPAPLVERPAVAFPRRHQPQVRRGGRPDGQGPASSWNRSAAIRPSGTPDSICKAIDRSDRGRREDHWWTTASAPRSGFFTQLPEGTQTVGEAFDTIRGWVTDHYGA